MNTLEDFQARGLYSPEYEHDACGIQKDSVTGQKNDISPEVYAKNH